MGGTAKLTHLVGIGQAKRMILGCDEIDAAEALRIGLVEIMVKKEELNDRAMKMVKRLANLPPGAIRCKKGINLGQSKQCSQFAF